MKARMKVDKIALSVKPVLTMIYTKKLGQEFRISFRLNADIYWIAFILNGSKWPHNLVKMVMLFLVK